MSSNSVEALPAPVIWIAATMIGIAVVCTLIRILRGPTSPDRIVAVDLLASLVMAGLLISGITSDNPFYLQITLGFAVILFLGTVALSRYLDRPRP
ncbi:monovalent cation/H+ antiporter complex subunit F [Haloferula rosea]|uniref:Cation:proton antiporter n=1 Tax=Haloferula rosea TaxID=490093 RepID=A0A934RBZ8_9BACT|nr:monovalent cation/H+ antiporter complex subunit F [Haloferula rosea]MBK1826509.1 hypothetical protein [Haloferula rosea]